MAETSKPKATRQPRAPRPDGTIARSYNLPKSLLDRIANEANRRGIGDHRLVQVLLERALPELERADLLGGLPPVASAPSGGAPA